MREQRERIRKWREIHSLNFLIFSSFPPSLSISYMKSCLILSKNIKYGTFVANVLLSSFNCIFRKSSVAVILLTTVIVQIPPPKLMYGESLQINLEWPCRSQADDLTSRWHCAWDLRTFKIFGHGQKVEQFSAQTRGCRSHWNGKCRLINFTQGSIVCFFFLKRCFFICTSFECFATMSSVSKYCRDCVMIIKLKLKQMLLVE